MAGGGCVWLGAVGCDCWWLGVAGGDWKWLEVVGIGEWSMDAVHGWLSLVVHGYSWGW